MSSRHRSSRERGRRLSQQVVYLLVGVIVFLSTPRGCDAIYKPKAHENFRIVLDTKSHRGPALGFRSNTNLDVDLKAMAKKFHTEAKDVLDRVWEETKKVTERLQSEAKDFVNQFKHYNKVEIGLYTALAVTLTLALKTIIFSKDSTKMVDIALISYVMNSPSAKVLYSTTEPVKELKRHTKPKVYVSYNVGSSDRKTYDKTTSRIQKEAEKIITSPLSEQSQPPPLSVERPAQVMVDSISIYYEDDEQVPTASHNAVLDTMTPAMRQKLRARRIRGGDDMTQSWMGRLTIGFYFIAWYVLNVVYNIVNKKILNELPQPLTVGTIQFAVGAVYCGLVWFTGLRPYPILTNRGKNSVGKVGLYHSLGQLASMLSLGAGPVSFTHIVKALEPFFSAIVSGIVFKKWMKAPVYATLIPVVGGVGYACLKELNFSWLAFGAAMASNLAFALRAVESKVALESGGDTGTNMTPPNVFGLVTWAALLISIPIALIMEGGTFMDLLQTAVEKVGDQWQFYRAILFSGLIHYLNNEVMYMALGSVHPVTLAVGNTMKRVFILVASVMVFRNPISLQAGIGSGVGIFGVLLYSLAKQYYETLEKQQQLLEEGAKGKKMKNKKFTGTKKTSSSSPIKVVKPVMKVRPSSSSNNKR